MPASESVHLRVNGRLINVPAGTIVAAAIARAGFAEFHRSVLGQSRGPLCGMGICMECRVTIDGRSHCRSCQIICQDDMEVQTDSIAP